MLKVFVATARTQGQRANDFTNTVSSELVDISTTCHDSIDGPCGCARAFTGLDSRKATTTAEIVQRNITVAQYRDAFHRSLILAGLPADDPEIRRAAEDDADQMRRLAAKWPVGTIVERRGDHIRVRCWLTSDRSS